MSQITLSAIVIKEPKPLRYTTVVSRKKQNSFINLSTQTSLALSAFKNLEENATSLLLQITTCNILRLL